MRPWRGGRRGRGSRARTRGTACCTVDAGDRSCRPPAPGIFAAGPEVQKSKYKNKAKYFIVRLEATESMINKKRERGVKIEID